MTLVSIRLLRSTIVKYCNVIFYKMHYLIFSFLLVLVCYRPAIHIIINTSYKQFNNLMDKTYHYCYKVPIIDIYYIIWIDIKLNIYQSNITVCICLCLKWIFFLRFSTFYFLILICLNIISIYHWFIRFIKIIKETHYFIFI